MEHFLINSSVCLFVLWIFYKLVLENTSWHRFKRWYLLGSIVIAVAIPFIVVKTVVIPIESSPIIDFANSTVVTEIMEQQEQPFSWTSIVTSIYLLGVTMMLWRFIRNLRSFQINEEDEVKPYDNYALVLRQVMTVPHSFIKRIFVSKDQYVKQLIPEVVLEHEKAHLDQKHSLDILLIELLLIVFWFNPLLYLIRYSIKLNHEFLADQAVLQSGIQTSQYQETLLSYTQNSRSTALANTFNFPIIKKRFHIMKTKTSSTSLVLRSMMIIPLLALLIISCGKEETHYEEIEEVIEVVEGTENNQKMIVVDGATSEGTIEIQGEPHYYKINDNNIDIYNKFGELQDFEKQGYEVIAVIEEEIEVVEGSLNVSALEYINEYKEDLNYYLRDDPIHADTAIKIINELGQNGVKISPDKDGVMSIKIKETDQNKKLLPPPPPPPPLTETGYIQVDERIYFYTTKKGDANLYDRKGNIIDMDGKTIKQIKKEDLPPPPPPAFSEVDKYNRWAREINAQNKLAEERGNNEYAIVKLKDMKRFEVIYNALSDTQKKNAAPWPDFPPPPPPAQKVKQTASLKNQTGYNYKGVKNDTTLWVKDFTKKTDVIQKQPKRRMIGDAVQVINLNRATLQAQYDGKNIHLDVAKKILVEHGQNGVYLDTINNQPTMVIQSKYFYTGPALPSQSPQSGDGC